MLIEPPDPFGATLVTALPPLVSIVLVIVPTEFGKVKTPAEDMFPPKRSAVVQSNAPALFTVTLKLSTTSHVVESVELYATITTGNTPAVVLEVIVTTPDCNDKSNSENEFCPNLYANVPALILKWSLNVIVVEFPNTPSVLFGIGVSKVILFIQDATT